MKTLYLLRHAKAAADSPSSEDRDRALNARGNDDAPAMAAAMKARGYVPDLVLCSSARRTVETCRHVLDVLGPDIPTLFEDGLYLASAGEILSAIRAADPGASALLVIGHNPGLEELAGALGKDGGPPKLPTSGLAVFTLESGAWDAIAPGAAHFTDYLTPKLLRG